MDRSSKILKQSYLFLMLLILHSLGPVTAKGKEQSTVGQSLTLVCAGTYEGTRYFKQIKQESLRGVLDEEFKGIIIEKDAVKKDSTRVSEAMDFALGAYENFTKKNKNHKNENN